jgi:hypothetical protein
MLISLFGLGLFGFGLGLFGFGFWSSVFLPTPNYQDIYISSCIQWRTIINKETFFQPDQICIVHLGHAGKEGIVKDFWEDTHFPFLSLSSSQLESRWVCHDSSPSPFW